MNFVHDNTMSQCQKLDIHSRVLGVTLRAPWISGFGLLSSFPFFFFLLLQYHALMNTEIQGQGTQFHIQWKPGGHFHCPFPSSSSVPALTHITHCHPAGCIHHSHGVHPSLVFSLTVVSESWHFDHIFKHSVTQLNLRLSQKAERDQMWSPRLAQAVMSLLQWLGSLSLDLTNLTELN